MDEIIIDERKYVSSKRAAKMTGYAKDYVGQLCREGRVPARLVGRSWYVLESAIQDHRFGGVVEEHKSVERENKIDSIGRTRIDSTWESPKYEAVSSGGLPSINRLAKSDSSWRDDEPMDLEEGKTVVEHLQKSWRGWFERASIEGESVGVVEGSNEPEREELEPLRSQQTPEDLAKEEIIEDEEVSVPVHTIYDLPPGELLPKKAPPPANSVEDVQNALQAQRTTVVKNRFVVSTLLVAAVFLAVEVTISSGLLDSQVHSLARVGLLSGVTIHEK